MKIVFELLDKIVLGNLQNVNHSLFVFSTRIRVEQERERSKRTRTLSAFSYDSIAFSTRERRK